MIVTLPSDVAAYTAWATACMAGTGSCSYTGSAGFPDQNEAIYSWGGSSSSTNSVRTIIFSDDPGGSGPSTTYAPLATAFTVTSFSLQPDTSLDIGAGISALVAIWGGSFTLTGPNYSRGAAPVIESGNAEAIYDYLSGNQMFHLEISRAGTSSWTHVLPSLEGYQANSYPVLAGDPNRLFVELTGEDPYEGYMRQFTGAQTIIPVDGSLTINPDDKLRITFFVGENEDFLVPGDPHVVFGPLSFVFDLPETEFWTNFSKTTEQAE